MRRWLAQAETLSGVLTVLAIAAALAMANSLLRDLYEAVHHTPVALRVGELVVQKPLVLRINEGLMVFFFLLVALELKREALEGHLASPARMALPAFAAAGGMLALAALNRAGVARTSAYVLLGTGVWVAVLESAVHATLAGVLIGLAVPRCA